VWTRRLTHREIAKETRIAPNIVSSTIKQMEMKKILHQNNKRYQINENYEEWIMEDRRTVKNLDSQESLLKESKNLPERVKNFDAEHPSTSSQTSDCETLKETIKETSKENTHVRIVNRWNELVDRDGKLPEYRREPDTLKSIVNERLKCYCEDEIVQAVENYIRFMYLPDDKKKWRGFCWTLKEFLAHSKDNIARFQKWETIKENYCKRFRPKKSVWGSFDGYEEY